MTTLPDRIEATRIRIGAALLEVQNLGRKHREAMGRLESAFMELGDLSEESRMRPHGVEDVA